MRLLLRSMFIVCSVGLFLTAGGRNESAADDVDDDDLRV